MAGEHPEWVRLLKYAGTAAVTVTMLTVFLFLAPVVGKDWTVRLAPYALCFSQKCRIGVTDDATASLWPSQPSPTSSTAYASYGLPVDVGDVVGVVYQRQDGRLAGGNGIVALEPAAIPSVNPFALSLFEGAAS